MIHSLGFPAHPTHRVQDKVIFGKGIFYFGGNRGRGQAQKAAPWVHTQSLCVKGKVLKVEVEMVESSK